MPGLHHAVYRDINHAGYYWVRKKRHRGGSVLAANNIIRANANIGNSGGFRASGDGPAADDCPRGGSKCLSLYLRSVAGTANKKRDQ